MSLKLWTDNDNPSAAAVLIAAEYAQIAIELPDIAKAELEKKSPLGKAPVLETSNGSIHEANAIVRYIARLSKTHALYGSNDFEAGMVDNWIDFSASEIVLPASVWIFPILGIISNNVDATTKAKADVRKTLDVLNKHLQTRTFLVGERITIADIVVALSLVRLYERVLDPGFRKQFQNTNRWYTTCLNQPQFKNVIGEPKLCQKMEVAKVVAAVETPKVEVPKEKKEQAPKEAKPKEKKKKDEDEEEEEDEALKEEKKKPSILESLPPSKFVMDDWKRSYSNNDIRGVALPWFWENLDEQGYSLWFAENKYPEENTKVFMTCNLVSGWIQRLDPLRKYGFGSVIIFGEEPRLEIGSVWLFRGLDVPEEMKSCDDYISYDWRKLSRSDKELINDYWAWDGALGGRKMNQGKIFK